MLKNNIFAGKFNLWVDDHNDHYAMKFLDELNHLNVVNLVKGPIASSSHTLDLILEKENFDLVTDVQVEPTQTFQTVA